MSEEKNSYSIHEELNMGEVQIADEVVAIIAGLAAPEVKGVSSMAGGFKEDTIARLGLKNLRAGVSVTVEEDHITAIDLALNINYGFSIVDVSREVQERVKNAVESMTGLEVSQVNVRVADVSMKDNQE